MHVLDTVTDKGTCAGSQRSSHDLSRDDEALSHQLNECDIAKLQRLEELMDAERRHQGGGLGHEGLGSR